MRWLIILLGSMLFVRAAAAQTTPLVHIAPVESEAQVGESLFIAVNIADVTDLYGFDIVIEFDPDVIQLLDLDDEEEGLQVGFGTFLDPGAVIVNGIDNENGLARLMMTQLNPSRPKSGSGALLALHARGVTIGETSLTISKVELAGPAGEVITPTSADGTLSIIAQPPAQPTPTPIILQPPGTPIADLLAITPTATTAGAATNTPPPTATPSSTPTATPAATATSSPTATPSPTATEERTFITPSAEPTTTLSAVESTSTAAIEPTNRPIESTTTSISTPTTIQQSVSTVTVVADTPNAVISQSDATATPAQVDVVNATPETSVTRNTEQVVPTQTNNAIEVSDTTEPTSNSVVPTVAAAVASDNAQAIGGGEIAVESNPTIQPPAERMPAALFVGLGIALLAFGGGGIAMWQRRNKG